MGYQVVQQPDGRLAVFSSFTDTIVIYDATREEITEWFVGIEVERARTAIGRVLDHVEAGTPREVYFQFAMTWADALRADQEHGGEVSKTVRI